MATDFYRATHMHSVDYAVAGCPSVGHMPVLCLNGYTLYISSKIFHRRVVPPF